MNLKVEGPKVREIALFHIARTITNLFKKFLFLLEDLREEHNTFTLKVKKLIPNEKLAEFEAAEYFDDRKFSYLRKKILDSGNEAKKEVEASLDNVLNKE